ncbi:Arsenate reductase [Clostridiaceae bacterium JG1575]|nr:Arsenate reductase [Clostridiaceae bacterium JG1575]
MKKDQLTLYAYSRCSTCRKAMAWLDAHDIAYEVEEILDNPPTTTLFHHWLEAQGVALSSLYNSSGEKYRELRMKDRIPTLSLEEQVALLASHGKLVKRPLLTDGNEVLVGFKEPQWAQALLESHS